MMIGLDWYQSNHVLLFNLECHYKFCGNNLPASVLGGRGVCKFMGSIRRLLSYQKSERMDGEFPKYISALLEN